MVTWHRTIKHFPANSLWAGKIWNSELKQRRQRRLRKRYLKSEFGLLPTLSRLFHFVQFVKCWQFLLDMNSKRLYRSRGKEQESRCLVLTSSTKPEIRQFYIVVVQGNVLKSVHTQSCCFANLNLLLFCRPRWRRRRRLLHRYSSSRRECWPRAEMNFHKLEHVEVTPLGL